MDRIDSFRGEFAFLSNFFVEAGGTTVEHLFQTAKTNDREWVRRILMAETPGKAKRLGRKAPLREDWESVKIDTMLACLRLKFRDPELARLLDETGDAELVEGNHWGDTFWGVCNGVGENHLGRLLMQVREENRK